MKTKVCYMDTETSGTDAEKHGIVQISLIIEIDNEIKEIFNSRVSLFEGKEIDPKALDITGLTENQIKTFPKPEIVFRDLKVVLNRHINPYNKLDKFYPAGQSVHFDISMLRQFFFDNGDEYFGSYFRYQGIDLLSMMHYLAYLGKVDLVDYKLKTVCDYFGVALDNAHDSLADIKATRECLQLYKAKVRME